MPNAMRTVQGEVPLYDKLAPFLDDAQNWLEAYFVPEPLMAEIEQVPHIVACEAFRVALPVLMWCSLRTGLRPPDLTASLQSRRSAPTGCLPRSWLSATFSLT